MLKINLLSKNKFGQGVDCAYFKINSRYGFKLFFGKHECEHAYHGQIFASTLKLAPRGFGFGKYKLSIDGRYSDEYGSEVYGFFTEKVNVLMNIHTYANKKPLNNQTLLKLMENLSLIGFGADLHDRNIGIRKGRLLCIDFGIDSVYYT